MKFLTKKSLGQHFLLNPVTIDQIIDAAHVGPKDCVLEIGPGPGVMTERLARRCQQIIAVEKDTELASSLRGRLAALQNLKIIEGDILDYDLSSLLDPARKYKVVSNLPYNIATAILFRLFDARRFFISFYLMVQREVAERIVAKPGSKDFGILSIMSQIYSENRIILKLPPGAFTPPPKVDSAVVQFQLSVKLRYPIQDFFLFRKIVEAAFSKRRKTIRNSLRAALQSCSIDMLDKVLAGAHIDPKTRPEDLPIEKFVEVANVLPNGL